MYTKVPLQESLHFTRKGPLATQWADANKGDVCETEYRSRLVAKEIKRKNDEDMVAATPTLEAIKLLFSLATTGSKGSCDPVKLLFIDVLPKHCRAGLCFGFWEQSDSPYLKMM